MAGISLIFVFNADACIRELGWLDLGVDFNIGRSSLSLEFCFDGYVLLIIAKGSINLK